MANGLTPALRSSDDDQIKVELGTVLLALRRLRADLASGRVRADQQLLSVDKIDSLLFALRPPAMKARPASRAQPNFQRTAAPVTAGQRSTSNWNALAQAVG
jgi:hypothetical protein